MDKIELSKAKILKGEFSPPPDKSISHRAAIFSSLAKGKSIIINFLRAEDPFSTINAFRSLGVEIKDTGNEIIFNGKGTNGLREPESILNCGNSGTTMRLLLGALSGNPFFTILTGDESLCRRPMSRVIIPLRKMGAEIMARGDDRYPPIAIRGKRLNAIQYTMPVASAQVKSALLLAGLYAEGVTEVIEPFQSRDHTERMLPAFGAEVRVKNLHTTIRGGSELHGIEVTVPGDFSSAAYFIVGTSLINNSETVVRDVGINPTRIGLLNILEEMGAEIEISNRRIVSGEPVADIYCKGGRELKAIQITRERIPMLIDEFPVLCVAATQATGITTIRGAEELRVKESDRINTIATELKKMGANIEEYEDGLDITGGTTLRGAVVESYRDHRIAMAMAIAAIIAKGKTTIKDVSSINISFPGFFEILKKLTA